MRLQNQISNLRKDQMTITEAKEILSRYVPLKKMKFLGDPIIGNCMEFPFSLDSTKEMEALIVIVNSAYLSNEGTIK